MTTNLHMKLPKHVRAYKYNEPDGYMGSYDVICPIDYLPISPERVVLYIYI